MSISVMGAFTLGILNTYLNPDFYQSDFFEEVIYEEASSEIIEQLQTTLLEISDIDPEELKAQLENLIPAEVLSETIQHLFEQLGGDKLPTEITISLSPIKDRIPSAIKEIAPFLNKSLPEELELISFENELTKNINQQIPDQLNVPLDEIQTQLNEPQRNALTYALTKGRTQIPPLILAAISLCLIMIGLLTWKPFWKVALWVGSTLIIDGASILASIFSIEKMGNSMLPEFSVNPAFLAPIISEMHTFALLLLGTGVLGYILAIGFFHTNKSKPKSK